MVTKVVVMAMVMMLWVMMAMAVMVEGYIEIVDEMFIIEMVSLSFLLK